MATSARGAGACGTKQLRVASKRWTQEPFAKAVRPLLAEAGLSARALAQQIGFDQSYFSRTAGSAKTQRRKVSLRLVEATADYFGVPRDHFLEYRQAVVSERVGVDPAYCDRCYRLLEK
jgi:transcriptional regulator with XRE-family HTH domain